MAWTDWAFDPIGTGLAGGPFWSSGNDVFGGGGKGGGGGGRPLSATERRLINQQIEAFQHQQRQQEYVFNKGQIAYNQANRAIPGLQNNIRAAQQQINRQGAAAAAIGTDRRNQLEAILAGQPADINALRDYTLSPDIARAQNQATQMALNQAGAPVWNPYVNNQLLGLGNSIGSPTQQAQFANLLMQAQSGAQSNPLMAYANQLQGFSGQSPATMDINQLRALSQANMIPGLENLRTLADRAGQIGAMPGAAESVLTPGAIDILSAAQRGETPDAIARLFQSNNTSERTALENQFDAARQRLVDRGIRGGALERALAGLEGQRALGISSQEARLEGQARDATLGLLGQGTTYGLTQPFQREQLALQGIQTGGQIEGLAGNLGIAQGQLQGALAGQAGGLGLSQLGLQGNLANLAGNQALQLQNLRQQALTAGGALAGDVYQNQLAGTALRGQFLNENIRNALAANQAQTANIGLAGQMGAQQIASQLGISQQNAALLSEILNQRSSLANQLGGGADALRFSTAPSLLTQGVQLNTLGATAPGLALDLLTGGRTAGSGGVDLGSALAAINNAQNYQQGPSRVTSGISGAISGAGTGAMVGSVVPVLGTAAGAVGGGILGLIGGLYA